MYSEGEKPYLCSKAPSPSGKQQLLAAGNWTFDAGQGELVLVGMVNTSVDRAYLIPYADAVRKRFSIIVPHDLEEVDGSVKTQHIRAEVNRFFVPKDGVEGGDCAPKLPELVEEGAEERWLPDARKGKAHRLLMVYPLPSR